jgi:hypothetical protein
MTFPKLWSEQELIADAAVAKGIFRDERIGEPLDLYKKYFDVYDDLFKRTIERLPGFVKNPVDPKLISELLRGKEQQKALRYLCAPPISEDDLKAVADVTSVAYTPVGKDIVAATKIRDTILSVLDPFRFPWVAQGKIPTPEQIDKAVIASSALAAAREVETLRRNTSKAAQEAAVKTLLKGMGWKEVPVRNIPILTAAPAPGEFCGESALAGTRADVVVRLLDGRVMPIECKVSNSSVNSYKRIVHDAGGKASHWYQQLGKAQVVPTAVMSGVFSVANLAKVQSENALYLYWQHRLEDLKAFILSVT